MKISNEQIKKLLLKLNYYPKDGVKDIFEKNYNGYIININFEEQKINYGNLIKIGDLTTSNFENSENFVVLECIDRILEKGYNPEDLSLEHKFPLGRKEKGKLDILIFKDNKAYIMIECKTWGEEYKKEQKRMLNYGGQLFSYYIQDKSAEYLCLYTSKLINEKIEYKNSIVKVDKIWNELNNQKEIYDYWNKNFYDNGIFEEWVNCYDFENKSLRRGQLKELSQDDSGRIFNQFAEILRHNAVSDKPNAFNKILNLFICKIIDEDKRDEEEVDFQWREDDTDEKLQGRLNNLYKRGMKKFLEIEVTDYSEEDLKNKLANIHEENTKNQIEEMFQKLRLQKNPEFAFKEVYNEQSFKMNGIVVKEIVELLQPYQFRYSHKQQFLGDFFELLLNTSIKQEAGQFFTPVPIAKFIISSIPIKEIIDKKINNDENNILPIAIDYASGSGHFLTEYMDELQKVISKYDSTNIRREAKDNINLWKQGEFKWANDCVYGIEADYRLVKTTKVSSFLNGDGDANIIRANGLDNFEKSKDYKGILKEYSKENHQDNKQFDIVIANPPYSVSSFKNTLENGKDSFELYKYLTDDSSEIECLFIERTKQLLKPGGIAGIILPISILTNSGIYIPTRELLFKYFRVAAITEFGSNTFMATGTNTVTLFLERREDIFHKNIEYALNNFIDNPQDFTINGITSIVSKYLEDVYENIDITDYLSIFRKIPNKNILKHNFYKEYKNHVISTILKSKKSLDRIDIDELIVNTIISTEREKLFNYILMCNDMTTIIKVKSKQKQDEKDFLGYEFSNRRGSEGIKIYRDEKGNHVTSLYDDNCDDNSLKANYYVKNALLNKQIDIKEEISKNIKIVKTTDLLDFTKVIFDKSISLINKKKIKFNSNYSNMKLGNLLDTIEVGDRPRGGVSKYKTGIISIGGEHIGLNQKLDLKNKKYVPKDFYDKANTGKINGGDILICKDGALSGKICKIPNKINEEMLANEHVYIIRTNQNVSQDYLFYILGSKKGQEILKANVNGAGIGGINQENLKNILIPVPPTNIQDKFTKRANEIQEQKKNIEEKIKDYFNEKNKLINSTFNTKTYNTLDEICELITDGTHNTPEYTKNGIPFLSATNVINKKIDWDNIKYVSNQLHEKLSKRISPKLNDILIAKNGTIGYAAIVDRDIPFDVYVSLAVLRTKNNILPEYVLEVINSETIRNEFLNKVIGMGVPNLHLNKIKEVKIPVVNYDEQEKFVKDISIINDKISRCEKEILKLDEDMEENIKTICN